MVDTHEIQSGDTLSSIAQSSGLSQEQLMQFNPNITNPNLIFAGQSLNLGSLAPDRDTNLDPSIGTDNRLGLVDDGIDSARTTALSEFAGTEIERQQARLLENQQSDLETRRVTEESERDTALLDVGRRPDEERASVLGRLEEEQDLRAKKDALDEIDSRMKRLQASHAAGRNALIGDSETMRLFRGKEAELNRQYNADLNLLLLESDTLQKNYNAAQSTVNTFFTQEMADISEEIARRQKIADMEEADVVNLDAEQKQFNVDRMNFLSNMNTQNKAELTQKQALIIDAAKFGISFSDAGLSLQDDYATMVEKLSPMISTEANRRQVDSERSDLQLVDDDGDFSTFDPATGQLLPAQTAVTRTDRNFNPIAISTARPEWQDALTEAGFNFGVEEGRDFGGGLATINFGSAEQGLEASKFILGKEIIDNAGGDISPFYWYKNHTGQEILDDYDINSPQEFGALPDAIKDQIVKDIYSNEQPGGRLFSEEISGEEEENEVLRNAISSLPAGQQSAAFSSIAIFKNAKKLMELLDDGVETGPLKGLGVSGVEVLGFPIVPGTRHRGTSTTEENEFVAMSTAIAANFVKSISGVAVSTKEMARLKKALPSISDTKEVNIDNLRILTEGIKNQYQLQLGINFDDFPNAIPNLENTSEDSGDILNNLLQQYGIN